MPGTEYAIKWESNRVGEVALEYSIDDGVTWTQINTGTSVAMAGNDSWGTFIWSVPSGEHEAEVRIYKYGEIDLAGYSGKFQITVEPGGAIDIHARTSISRLSARTGSIAIYDLQGRMIMTCKAGDMHLLQAKPNMHPGLYILRAHAINQKNDIVEERKFLHP
jgi:hypothetical protein